MQSALCTTNEVAKMLGISRFTVSQWAREGYWESLGVHPIKLGKVWRFKTAEIRKLLR